jgi:oligopeptide transport system substrate-binding protein
VAVVIFLLSCCGCERFPKAADFTFINGAEPESLDPAVVTGQPEERLCMALFEGLTSRNGHGEIEPGMAERWEISPDGKTYTFHLREAHWSNGDPVTAFDFFRSWKRVLDPQTAARYVEQLYYLENAEQYNHGAMTDFSKVGVQAIDIKTLRVRLKQPTPFFLQICAFMTLLPVHFPSIEQWGEDWIKPGKLVSNGAYELEDWRIDDRIRLRANPWSWRKNQVHLPVIDVLPTSQATTAFNLFYSGKVDLVLDKGLIPTFLIPSIKKKPYVHSTPFLATYFYRFNTTRPPFNNRLVRKALDLAIDKRRIVEKITQAGEQPAGSFTPPGMPGYRPPAGLEYNPAEARRLLAEAGFPDGQGFPPFSILYNSSEINEQIAVEVQAMWHDQLHLRVHLRTEEWKVYLGSLQKLDYDVARSTWVGDYDDPNTFLGCFLSTSGNNNTGYENPRFDHLINEANRQTNPARRFQLMREAESLLVEQDLPLAPLYHFVGITLYDGTKWKGIEPNLVDEHPLREMDRVSK